MMLDNREDIVFRSLWVL